MRSGTTTLISALRILSRDIQSEDGVANAAIAEAADRLEELSRENAALNETTRKHVAAYYELMAENAALRKALSEADVIAEYSRDDGHRDWWSGGYWLHTGEVLVCMDRAAFDAARKEAQP